MALHVLAYNLTRITNIMGVQQGVFTLPRLRKASRGASVCQSGSEIESGSRLWRSRADMRLQPFYFPTIAISTFPIARASVIVKRS
jgi:hypothetical protein